MVSAGIEECITFLIFAIHLYLVCSVINQKIKMLFCYLNKIYLKSNTHFVIRKSVAKIILLNVLINFNEQLEIKHEHFYYIQSIWLLEIIYNKSKQLF